MVADDIDRALINYLTDAYSIEQQALQQLRSAPKIAKDTAFSVTLQDHLHETETHEQLIRERLEAHGESPSKLKDAVMRAGGVGFMLFARSQPDTPGKLMAHAYSYEHLEEAAYELLKRVARRAGDEETVQTAERIRTEEHAMGERLAGLFDNAVEASLGSKDAAEKLPTYLADAHAIEAQAIELLKKGPAIAGDEELARAYSDHLEETRDQQRRVRDRLEQLEKSPSVLKDAVLRIGALNWGMFFAAQPDTPGKLAAFAYAFEHLEIGGYEELKRVAERAGDTSTVVLAEEILVQERAAADRIAAAWDRAAEASLDARRAG
jgi:ferritin-like metal-binding protein YciE